MVFLHRQRAAPAAAGGGPEHLDATRRALPMWSAREKLVQQVRDNPVLIVIGETGSGKTTQVGRLGRWGDACARTWVRRPPPPPAGAALPL